MRKHLISLAILLAIFCTAGKSSAVLITDTVIIGETTAFEGYVSHNTLYDDPVNFMGGMGDFVIWEHMFDVPDGTTAQDPAIITLTFLDDERDTLNPLSWELAIFLGENILSFSIDDVDTGTWSTSINPSFLNDGHFYASITSGWRDFSILKSEVSFATSNPVPEPSTILLIGLVLVIGLIYKAVGATSGKSHQTTA